MKVYREVLFVWLVFLAGYVLTVLFLALCGLLFYT
jgi:hypothetical protein